VVEEIAMKLAQVQEKNEALNSEKLRLEGYLRTAKKVLALQAQWPSPWLQSHHYSLLLCTR
jgi:ubiquinone biosynthesis protein UbiJ